MEPQTSGSAAVGRNPLHSLIKCNPFYLVSALLLIYGIYRTAIDPFFMSRDRLQLLFSFGALEVYGAMLVATAIFLARRAIWYDSTLLVFLQNLLVLIPFMLVSHAVFMSSGLAWSICLGSSLLTAIKFGAFRRFFPGLNLPPQALVLGAVLLGVNITLPLLFRRGLESSNDLWAGRSEYLWQVMLPLLVLLANLLPQPRPAKGARLDHEQAWIPLLSYLLWVLGTAVHIYVIGYVDDRPFGIANVTAFAWALSWLFVARASDLTPHIELSAARKKAFLLVPVAVTLLSLTNATGMTVALHLLNALILASLAVRFRERSIAALSGASVLIAFLALPEAAIAPVISGYHKLHLVGGLIIACGLWISLRTRTAKAALLGGISVASAAALAFPPESEFHGIVQSFALYFIVHSAFWTPQQERGSGFVRWLVLTAWTVDSIAMQGSPETAGAGYTVPLALLLWGGAAWFYRKQTIVDLGLAVALAYLATPTFKLAIWFSNAPLGVIAILAAFTLFALGTAHALLRRRLPGGVSSHTSPES